MTDQRHPDHCIVCDNDSLDVGTHAMAPRAIEKSCRPTIMLRSLAR